MSPCSRCENRTCELLTGRKKKQLAAVEFANASSLVSIFNILPVVGAGVSMLFPPSHSGHKFALQFTLRSQSLMT